MIVGVLLLEVDFVLTHGERSESSPCDEAQVCICALVTNQVLFSFQCIVQHLRDTLNFVGITLNG